MVKASTYSLLVLCICIINISPFSLQQNCEAQPSVSLTSISSHSSLGFADYTSPNTTADQVATFINFINSASIYFRDYANTRLDYISNQMNKTYGISDNGFSVIQQGDEGYYSWAIYSFTSVYASRAAGVDKVFPSYSYMFIQEPFSDTNQRVFLEKVGQKGNEINSTLEVVINNVILAVQSDKDSCSCQGNVESIRTNLHGYDGGYWNVICSTYNAPFKMDVYVKGGKYIYSKPNHCYYGIYAIK